MRREKDCSSGVSAQHGTEMTPQLRHEVKWGHWKNMLELVKSMRHPLSKKYPCFQRR